VKIHLPEPPKLDDSIESDAPVTGEEVQARVRRFAVLRAAQRALSPSTAEPLDQTEFAVIRGIREHLGALTQRLEAEEPAQATPLRDELQLLDGALAGYAHSLLALLERIPLAQLRASLAPDTHEQRVEVAALLELCLDAEPTPSRHLRAVDFLVTLLSVTQRDGRWVVELDPANLNDTVRARCEQAGYIDTNVETRIVSRFREAADRVASGPSEAAVMEEMSAYKVDIASFYFVPAVLRCIVGYNAAARNHIGDRLRRGRAADAEIDDELGCFAPLARHDPRAAGSPAGSGLPAHEHPGVLALQEAIRHRLLEAQAVEGHAERIASQLDLSWLEREDREAFLDPSRDGAQRMIRMSVVLGHLAMCLRESARDAEALGLHESQIDAWICALGDEVQHEIDTRIRENSYEGALHLGAVKSRFLAAVLLVARRRLGRRKRGAEVDSFSREALDLVRQHLERERFHRANPIFMDLLGGGWRRTVALATIFLVVGGLGLAEWMPSSDPRAVSTLEKWQARDISPLLASAYRDYAHEDSVFVGTVLPRWFELSPDERRETAEAIRAKVQGRGVDEIMLFDEHRVLQAHWFEGRWRGAHAWKPEGSASPGSSMPRLRAPRAAPRR
jgi:hypothetical protein